jgi:hypothetical protein
MNRSSFATRIFVLLAMLTALFGIFFLFVRPWYLDWGATEGEIQRVLPGDEIIPNAVGQNTHAITIGAGIEQVWPWVAQLGQDRGGFYSYDLLENIVGCEMPTSDYLHPAKQSWAVGDKLWMYPPDKAGGMGFATLRTYIPGRGLGFSARSMGTPVGAKEDGSWSFALEPVNASSTRLLVRGRGAAGRSLLGVAFDRAIFEPVHFAMERRMMIGIKDVAESGTRHRIQNHAQVVLWTIVFAFFGAAVAMVLTGLQWRQALLTAVMAGVVFQILTFVQPSLPIGTLLASIVAAVLWWPAPATTPHERRDLLRSA